MYCGCKYEYVHLIILVLITSRIQERLILAAYGDFSVYKS